MALSVGPTFVTRSQSDIDRLHAFRLLVHSELQAFLDEHCELILDRTADRSTAEGVLTHAGHHLLVHYSIAPLGSPATANESRYPHFVPAESAAAHSASPARLASAISKHRKQVLEKNNGIKAGNVRRLLTPLGYREELFAPGLLDQLDALGRARGDVAHRSGVVGTNNAPSGSAEYTRLQIILPGLELIERYAPRLLRDAIS